MGVNGGKGDDLSGHSVDGNGKVVDVMHGVGPVRHVEHDDLPQPLLFGEPDLAGNGGVRFIDSAVQVGLGEGARRQRVREAMGMCVDHVLSFLSLISWISSSSEGWSSFL